jgi:hypothetical protein
MFSFGNLGQGERALLLRVRFGWQTVDEFPETYENRKALFSYICPVVPEQNER